MLAQILQLLVGGLATGAIYALVAIGFTLLWQTSQTITPPLHRSLRSGAPHSQPHVGGRLQVKLWFDAAALQLVVTVVCASGLTPRANGQPRNPYAKLFLLPDRRYASTLR